MSEVLRQYLLQITAAALFSSLTLCLLPKTNVRRIAALVCGLLTALCVLKPLVSIDSGKLARAFSELLVSSEEAANGLKLQNREVVGQVIKEKTEAYILDKAELFGIELSVSVTVGGEGTYPYPTAADFYGRPTEAQKRQLTRLVEENLAIPKEKQQWHSE